MHCKPDTTYCVFRPTPALDTVISHYWVSLHNRQQTHRILPDGSLDIVIEFTSTGSTAKIYGTTSQRSDITISPDSHYLGIRFRPGQIRHFIHTNPADITNTSINANDILSFHLTIPFVAMNVKQLILHLDNLLLAHFTRVKEFPTHLDKIIHHIELSHGRHRIEEYGVQYGRSRRQFERNFRDTVGLSPKRFAQIVRFRYALSQILPNQPTSLCQIALGSGYSDQSHMNREFKLLSGSTPLTMLRENVAFIQDDLLNIQQ